MNIDLGDIGYCTSIVVIVYLFGQGLKCVKQLDNEWIPVLCGTCGLILGIGAFVMQLPSFPANDWYSAAAVGILSGLAATGVNQIYKQLKRLKAKTPDDDSI